MTMQKQLDQYYKGVGIAPVSWSSDPDEMFKAFKCKNKCACRDACRGAWNKKEEFVFEPRAEGVTVSQEYHDGKYHGKRIPRIVVLSLSKPQPSEPESKKSPGGRNVHWPKTLVTVRSLLSPFISCEDESTKDIKKLFVHVRTAKCCSNAKGAAKEPSKVYTNCSRYLRKELSILKPDVIVTQGNDAHWGATRHAFNAIEQVKGLNLELPIAHIVNLKEGNQCVYWLRMIFPTYRFGHMKTWDKQAGPEIESESHGVGAKREHLVLYGEKIKKFINDR